VISVGNNPVVPYLLCASTIALSADKLVSWLNKMPPPPLTCTSIKPRVSKPETLITFALLTASKAITLPFSKLIGWLLVIFFPSNTRSANTVVIMTSRLYIASYKVFCELNKAFKKLALPVAD